MPVTEKIWAGASPRIFYGLAIFEPLKNSAAFLSYSRWSVIRLLDEGSLTGSTDFSSPGVDQISHHVSTESGSATSFPS